MRLLLISRCPPYPLHLGDRLILYHLASELSRRGYSLDLLAFYDRPDDPAHCSSYDQCFQEIVLIRAPRRGVPAYLRRLAGRMHPRRAEEAWSPEMWRAIERQLAVNAYGIVQLFGGVQVYEYRALVRHLPNLIVPYESYSLFLERVLELGSRRLIIAAQRAVARRYERAMFNGYDRVVVLTDADANALRALNPSLPLRVIPNGIDLAYFTPGPASGSTGTGPPILLFVGNYEYAPNVDAACFLADEIFPRVRRHVPAARLQLVGNAPTPAIQALHGDSIEVTGHVPDVRPYLERAAVFIAPLRFGAGIKNKVLEAMAMGKPLVATRLSGDGIGLEEGIHVLYGDTAEALSQAAVQLLEDADRRQIMGEANRRLIEERFTWRHVADQYEALYREIRSSAHLS